MTGRMIAAAMAALIAGASQAAREARADPPWWSGPSEDPNQYVLALMHLYAEPASAALPREGETRGRIAYSWASTSILERAFVVDAETRVIGLKLSRGLSDRFAAEISLPLVWRGGGVLDSLIEGWHRAFNLPGGNREKLDQDEFQISGVEDDGDPFEVEDQGASLGNIAAGGAYAVYSGEEGVLSLRARAGAKAPGGDEEFSHGGVDFMLGLAGTHQAGDLGLHANLSWLHYLDEETSGVEFYPDHGEAYLGATYLIGESAEAIVGAYGGTPLIENIAGHPRHFFYLDVGIKLALSEDAAAELMIRENPGSGYSSADVSMAAALSFRFE